MADEKNKIIEEADNVERISFNIYEDAEKTEIKNKKKNTSQKEKYGKNGIKIIAILSLALIIVYIYSSFFSVNLSVPELSLNSYGRSVVHRFKLVFDSIFNFKQNSNGMANPIYRSTIIAFVGAALAVSGAIYQGLFRNPMASPDVLGVSAAGSLGGAIFIMIFYLQINYNSHGTVNFFEMFGRQIFTYGFGVIGVMFVVGIAKAAGRGKISTVSLVLSGVVFSSLVKSIVSFIRYIISQMDPNDERLPQVQSFLMGNFNIPEDPKRVVLICIPIIICMIPVMLMRSKMNALVFGEEEAQAFGINVKVLRNVLIIISTLLTSITIAFCGPISWVGLVIPHVTRFFTGPDYRILLPAAMITGAVFTLTAYNIAYAIGMAFYVDIFISVMGVPVFIYFLIKARRGKNADWA